MTMVLMAARDMDRGAELTADAMRWQPWPADAVASTFIDNDSRPDALQDLTGRYSARAIAAGEPISESALSGHQGGNLAAMLEPGKRAIAIRADAESTAGGFILPNDRVDVFHTPDRERADGTLRSRAILRGVRVLAIDQTSEDPASDTVLGKTATLELTETQAEVVIAAEATGRLALALRPLTEPTSAVEPEPEEAPRTIRIYRGGEVEDVEID